MFLAIVAFARKHHVSITSIPRLETLRLHKGLWVILFEPSLRSGKCLCVSPVALVTAVHSDFVSIHRVKLCHQKLIQTGWISTGEQRSF